MRGRDDPAIRDHQAWLGYLQPDGLVVSPAALVDAQVVLDRGPLARLQEAFRPFAVEVSLGEDGAVVVTDFTDFAKGFLEWPSDLLIGAGQTEDVPEALKVPLPEFGETLAPTLALRDPHPADASNPWLLVVHELPHGADLDAAQTGEAQWSASHARRFERLLRETRVPIGVLCNGTHIRLIYAPRGETVGSVTFPVSAMLEVAGRPILGALHLLLHRQRLLAGPSEARLPALLARSRAYQASVSGALAEQVLDALYELVRGLQSANETANGRLLEAQLRDHPDEIYAGLLTVLLRLVFLLYAEDRGLLPAGELYVRHYAMHGLFERLRADHERFPDTMDHRFGAWAQLLALFRAVHRGCRHPQLAMPTREGYLFDPDRYPFLEGRAAGVSDNLGLPLISDGVVFRVLRGLLILDGERLSYRTLDVEQIGSVYETMMGFRLEVTKGTSIAIRPAKSRGAPIVVDLDALLGEQPTDRPKWLAERTDQKITGEALKAAASTDDLLAALDRKIATRATPHPVPPGTMVLQPTDERRRSGSHYTPRSLTEPIVRTALRPILERLGEHPTPAQLLDLKVCDMAVGSGAFLVEACRQLGDALVAAWHHHRELPLIPPDEDEVLHARRIVAQRCLYGVDRNPMAVDLAKLSLWLATLARDHPFTFLDHSLRWGDSLVGLTGRQIADFHWEPDAPRVLGQDVIEDRIRTATASRRQILEADEEFTSPALKRQKLDLADEALNLVRLAGDSVVAGFFAGDTDKARKRARDDLLGRFTAYRRTADGAQGPDAAVTALKAGPLPVLPFHWEVEFPEVFGREAGGFDAIVGNPPFAGKNTLLNGNREGYLDWLLALHGDSHGASDLVAHFFRRAFSLVRPGGSFGLIATNTISQGDTRHTGLRWICTHGGTIYAARKRLKWPGEAAVVVSVVHVSKGEVPGPHRLDDRDVPVITAFLFHQGGHESPAVLRANEGRSFQGSIVLGMGFTFDDTDTSGVANPIALMDNLIAQDPRNAERIFPYIGGEEVNDSPTHAYHRYVIDFFDRSLEEASQWPDLVAIVFDKVKPIRDVQKRDALRERWWQYAEKRPGLYGTIRGTDRVLVNSQVSSHLGFAFVSSRFVFGHTLNVYAVSCFASFAVLQSRPHEVWARFFASSLEDRLRYTSSDCFDTFPFAVDSERDDKLEAGGREYYEFRAALMARGNEGLTKIYNRFHDPDERSPDILRLRELHATVDRTVLDAYGWQDIQPTCEFLLDYEEEEDEQAASRRKKPYRYRWPDEIRDEVLTRLLALNKERAVAERVAGAAGTTKARKKTGRKKGGAGGPSGLFG